MRPLRLPELLKSAGLRAKAPAALIRSLADDSRKVRPGALFASLPSASGRHADAAAYARQAAARGAAAVLAPKGVGGLEGLGVPVLRSGRIRADFARLCAVFHAWPSRRLALTGVTGTNGKTTTTFLLKGILERAGRPSALLGTVGYFLPGRSLAAPNTTPGSLDLQAMLAEALARGARAAVMEVSSHALAQDRVAGLDFRAAVFTNLTRDHLDYHRGMAAYAGAKARLFSQLGKDGVAVVNAEDGAHARMARARTRGARLIRFHAGGGRAELRALHPRFGAAGTRFALAFDGRLLDLELPLPGPYNVANALAAAGAALGQGISLDLVAAALERPLVPPGRFEMIRRGQPFGVVVDYAHTPDALERLIRAARTGCAGRIITLFGCGGDRDAGKRPKMGRVAARLSDLVLATSDNPRSEDPEAVLDEVLAGVPRRRGAVQTVLRVADRRQAIRRALKLAKPGDCVLLAGKGHEDYQILAGGKVHFDDREEARAGLAALGYRGRG